MPPGIASSCILIASLDAAHDDPNGTEAEVEAVASLPTFDGRLVMLG